MVKWKNKELAAVSSACGRTYLEVAGITLAMEGDICRTSDIPEDIMPPIPQAELENANVGGTPATELSRELIRFFRRDYWTTEMMEYVANKINQKENDNG